MFERGRVAGKGESLHRNIVVIGASAGGVETMTRLVAGLPEDLAVAVLIVVHTSPSGRGYLPAVLQRVARVPVSHGEDGEPVSLGRIYVARPDHHLLVSEGLVRVTRGPKENHTRPAIDPLFRSAAISYGSRVVGIVMTGLLDDGTAGLMAVKLLGGTTIAQDPADAMFPDLPRNAIRRASPDHVVRASELPALITRLAAEPTAVQPERHVPKEMRIEDRIAREDHPLKAGVMELGPASPFTCPECHGVLLHVANKPISRYRCHTGHAFSIDTLLATISASAEDALWSALRAMEENMMLLGHMAQQARQFGDDSTVEALEVKARETALRSEMVRQTAILQETLSSDDVRHPTARTHA